MENDPTNGIVFFLILFAIYFLPSIIAVSKKKKNGVAIFVTNLLLGWTVLGWIISLIWSVTND